MKQLLFTIEDFLCQSPADYAGSADHLRSNVRSARFA